MCFMPDVRVEQSCFGYGKKYEKARNEARGSASRGKPRLDPCGLVKRTTISLPPHHWNMIPKGANRSQWIRKAIQSSVSPPYIRTNYNRQTFQNQTHSIIIDSSLSPSQKASCLTSIAEGFIVSAPI